MSLTANDQVAPGATAGTPRVHLQQIRDGLDARIHDGALELPILPRVAGEVLAMAGDPTMDAARLSALIHRDPALAGHVLRIANSPAYLPRTPIVSLQQALTRLGFTTITEIALAASLQMGVFRLTGYEGLLAEVRRHSVASGVFAKEIARVRRWNVESAFLCGFLHAIGKPVVLQAAVDFARKRLGATGLATSDAAALMDELHPRVGVLVAERWALPAQVRDAIAHYRSYRDLESRDPGAMITCLADHLATYCLVPSAFLEDSVREHPVFGDLNLYADDVDTLLARATDAMKIVEALAV